MEVTEGLFTEINIAQWKLLPMLDMMGLDAGKLQCPSAVFDKYARKDLGNIKRGE